MQAETSKLHGYNSLAITITFLPLEIYISVNQYLQTIEGQSMHKERSWNVLN